LIISVPHSGTRSLRKHLAQKWDLSWEPEDPHFSRRVTFWHFGMNDPDIDEWDGEVHVPLRDPIKVALSWESRYQNEAGHTTDDMLRAFNKMIQWTQGRDVTFWHTSKLPHKVGAGPEHPARNDRAEMLVIPRIVALREWYRNSESVQQFYSRHFKKGFWWT